MSNYEHEYKSKYPYGEIKAKLIFENGKSINVCVTEYEEKLTTTNYTGFSPDKKLYTDINTDTMKIWKVMSCNSDKKQR